MRCYINGTEKKIGYTAANMPPYNEMTKVGFCIFDIFGETEICVEFEEEVISAVCRPLSLKTEYRVHQNSVVLRLNEACNLSLEINDDPKTAFFIFANSPEKPFFEGFENILRYAKGEHNIDELLIKEDNTLVVIEDGAVLNGRIIAQNVENLKICGTGIITMKDYTRGLPEEMTRCIELCGCKNAVIEDICVFDSCNWSVRLNGCDNSEVKNLKIIGARGNSDGVDICGSRNIRVSGCFIRSFDDCLVLKAFETGDVENVVFENCVLWNDMARPIEVGVELRCDRVRNVFFRDIDVIHSLTCYPIFGIHHGDRAEISDVHFENIRIENAPGAQLFDFRITNSVWNKDSKKGSIKDVYVDNINFCGTEGKDLRAVRARIEGFSEESSIKNVHIGKISAFGKEIKGKKALGLEIPGAVSGVEFAGGGESPVTETEIVKEKPFELKNDGKYHGEIKLVLKNISKIKTEGLAGIKVYPKNKAEYDDGAFFYSLLPGEKTEKTYKIKTDAGKLAIESFGDRAELLPSADYTELDYPLFAETEKAPKVKFGNYYGDEYGEVGFACNEKWLEISSELLKEYDMELFTANTAETEENQVMFSVEESYFGEAPSVKFKNGKYVSAPEIGNHWEITYVFLNQPKVGEIKRNILSKNFGGKVKIPFECLGINPGKKEFLLELRLIKECGYKMPQTLFRSTLPTDTAHMFCKFIRTL